jgi:GNAT superfamily N-acetyltransferase
LSRGNDIEMAMRTAAPAALEVRRADESMIPFVMETERTPGFDVLVGRWDEARHRAALTDGQHAYFIARDDGRPIGFAIVRDWASPERAALVKRIAVAHPGLGHGRALLSRVVDACSRRPTRGASGSECSRRIRAPAAPTRGSASASKGSPAGRPSSAASTGTNS